ncbi:hypothetical protein Vretimale_2534 [Volvox reticuliferus]|nr:hypothetical protein Vretimale_2534 [Volvox reticuliferus]
MPEHVPDDTAVGARRIAGIPTADIGTKDWTPCWLPEPSARTSTRRILPQLPRLQGNAFRPTYRPVTCPRSSNIAANPPTQLPSPGSTAAAAPLKPPPYQPRAAAAAATTAAGPPRNACVEHSR